MGAGVCACTFFVVQGRIPAGLPVWDLEMGNGTGNFFRLPVFVTNLGSKQAIWRK